MSRVATAVVSLVMLLSLGVMAPGAHAQDEGEQTPAPTEEATPEPTATTTPDDGDADDDSETSAVLIGILIVVVVVALIALFGAMGSRSGARHTAAAPPGPSPKRQMLGNIQWFHDQLSLELMAAPGAQARQRWQSERFRVDEMGIACQQFASGADGVVWQQLAAQLSSCATALDTATTLRADPDVDPTLAREAVGAVNRQRAELFRLSQIAAQTA